MKAVANPLLLCPRANPTPNPLTLCFSNLPSDTCRFASVRLQTRFAMDWHSRKRRGATTHSSATCASALASKSNEAKSEVNLSEENKQRCLSFVGGALWLRTGRRGKILLVRRIVGCGHSACAAYLFQVLANGSQIGLQHNSANKTGEPDAKHCTARNERA